MFEQIARVLSARVLMAVAGVVLGCFVLSAVIAAAFGRHPDSGVADALGAIGWFGFLISALVLLVLTTISLIAHGIARNGNPQRRELT